MLIVTMKRSPPKSRSARPSAVSVLPTPLGPTSRNTPSGCAGGLRPERAARSSRAMTAEGPVLPANALRAGGPRGAGCLDVVLHHLADGDARPVGDDAARRAASSTSAWTSELLGLDRLELVDLARSAALGCACCSASARRPLCGAASIWSTIARWLASRARSSSASCFLSAPPRRARRAASRSSSTGEARRVVAVVGRRSSRSMAARAARARPRAAGGARACTILTRARARCRADRRPCRGAAGR